VAAVAELRAAVAAGPVARPHVVVHVAVSVDGATTGFAPDIGRFYELARTWHEDVTLTGADTILAQEEALAAQPGPGPADGGPLLAVVDGRRRVRAWRALRDAGHWSAVVALRCRAGGGDGQGALAKEPGAQTDGEPCAQTDGEPCAQIDGEPCAQIDGEPCAQIDGEPCAQTDAGPDAGSDSASDAVDELVVGEGRVDLGAALSALGTRGAKVVRVDSGGLLTGALLRAGLVDEISLLVHPCLATAADGPAPDGPAPDGPTADGPAPTAHHWFGASPPPASALRLVSAETFDDALVWLRYRC
jgi:2,5-diamino-6-(ribosylamino)-4(3H)-pyrimidinone 5'-phosphate reductase